MSAQLDRMAQLSTRLVWVLQSQSFASAAEIIGVFAFDEDLQALQLEKGLDGTLQLAPQPFVQVNLPHSRKLA